MSQYNDIDSARAAIESSINLVGGSIAADRLSIVSDAYDSVTGIWDYGTIWLYKPDDIYPDAWQVICFYRTIAEQMDDGYKQVAEAFLTAAETNAQSEYEQSYAGIIEGTVTESTEDVVEIAENIKETVETATKPPVILAAIIGLIGLFLALR